MLAGAMPGCRQWRCAGEGGWVGQNGRPAIAHRVPVTGQRSMVIGPRRLRGCDVTRDVRGPQAQGVLHRRAPVWLGASPVAAPVPQTQRPAHGQCAARAAAAAQLAAGPPPHPKHGPPPPPAASSPCPPSTYTSTSTSSSRVATATAAPSLACHERHQSLRPLPACRRQQRQSLRCALCRASAPPACHLGVQAQPICQPLHSRARRRRRRRRGVSQPIRPRGRACTCACAECSRTRSGRPQLEPRPAARCLCSRPSL